MTADFTHDAVVLAGAAQVLAAHADTAKRPNITAFFDEPTNTISYIVADPTTKMAAIVDSVLDYDAASGRTSTGGADAIIAEVARQGLTIQWLLETHAHADHLSAAPYLQAKLGGEIAIGSAITHVQTVFGKLFNHGTEFARDGSQFDHLFGDGDSFPIGNLQAEVMHVPGHTPADMAYIIGDAAFIGDTLFMPDYGTARCDFPGGDAQMLYRSIRRLLSLPAETRLFLCHDYLPEGRETYVWESTVAAQRAANIHVHDGVDEAAFVAMRTARDATLSVPKLIVPSVQVNIRGGRMPEPEDNGVSYIKVPVNVL